jgi:hypothetical protein
MPTIAPLTALPGHPAAISIPNPFSAGAGEVTQWIVDGTTKAINAFFSDLVKSALDPLLTLLGHTLLGTPELSSLPRIGQLWENSRQIAVAVYALIILIAGILVMAYETVQTRHSIKEILPRLVTAFLTANLSLILATQTVSFANALSLAVLGQDVNSSDAANVLTALVMNSVSNGGIFLVLLGLVLAGILLALLVGYVIRVAATVILIAGAPLALMCHALPQTEAVARWWWRAFTGVLAIQLCQSLTLVAAMNVFLTKGGFTFFGPTTDGLVNLIVTIALLYILFKIPFWILHHVQAGGGRSFIGSAVKGVIAYKTLGVLGLSRGGAGAGARRAGGNAGARRAGGGGAGPAGSGLRPGGPSRPSGGGPAAGRPRTGRPVAGSGQPRPRAAQPPDGRSTAGSMRGQLLLPLDLSGTDRSRDAAAGSRSSRSGAASTASTPSHRDAPGPRLALPRLPIDLPRRAPNPTPRMHTPQAQPPRAQRTRTQPPRLRTTRDQNERGTR